MSSEIEAGIDPNPSLLFNYIHEDWEEKERIMMLLIVTATQEQPLLLEADEKFLYWKGGPLGYAQYNNPRNISTFL